VGGVYANVTIVQQHASGTAVRVVGSVLKSAHEFKAVLRWVAIDGAVAR
jgi:hypothetical protein